MAGNRFYVRFVEDAFSNEFLCKISWRLRRRWPNCTNLSKSINFYVSHILREGSSCADKLASYHIPFRSDFSWWDRLPNCVRFEFAANRLGFPVYRFN
ncbi:hypothetical protein Fmac_008132 [Flemingia macrophylla]|uniref:Uncharacterized protein n=1 Tax=Flemingia macrophylla TaxID=520843 RepID=A0ABD1MWJ6_9FABA